MNEQKINELAREVAEFVLLKAEGIDTTPLEVSMALGQAIIIIVSEPLVYMGKVLEAKSQAPEEEEEEEENGEEFEFLSLEERTYAFSKCLSSDPEAARFLAAFGEKEVPEWLRKEIIERRG